MKSRFVLGRLLLFLLSCSRMETLYFFDVIMHVEKTALDGVLIIKPEVFPDERGFFMVAYEEKTYREALGITGNFVQDNISFSKKNVIRGLHYQVPPFAQGKLLQVHYGKIMDVAVDIRFGSPTFGRYVTVELSGENHQQLYIPEGFAHGFAVLSDEACFVYKCTGVYSQEHDRGILYNDPSLGIAWGVTNPVVSEKDRRLPLLKDISSGFVLES